MHRFLAWSATAMLLTLAVAGHDVPAQSRSPAAEPPLIAVGPLARGETPVLLQSASAEVATAGSLARTTLLLTLYNPNDRVLEGSLTFPLQPGQQVAGFALDLEGHLREAVPVPKARGREIFEEIERGEVDPALLEQVAGNHFRLRVYPLPAKGTRTVRLTIDEAMAREQGDFRLDVPVHLLSQARVVNLRVQGQANAPRSAGRLGEIDFQRAGPDFEARLRGLVRGKGPVSLYFPAARQAQAYTGQADGARYALVEIPSAEGHAKPRRIPERVGLLWDASASARHRDRASELALLDRYFRAMDNGRVRLRLLRDVGEDAGEFVIRDGQWSQLRAALESAVYDGATNLADWTTSADIAEYLLVSDGLHNYGSESFPRLGGGQRLFALNSAGGRGDAIRLHALAEAGHGRVVGWQGRAELNAATRALLEEGIRISGVRGEGIEDLQVQSHTPTGGVLRIAGRLTRKDATVHVSLDDGSLVDGSGARVVRVPVSARTRVAPQVPALWASWRVAALSQAPVENRAAIARLGQQFGVVTPGTSLLVLEQPEDYVRFDVPAPPDLREAVARLRNDASDERARSRQERVDEVAALFAQRVEWWGRKFPKARPRPQIAARSRAELSVTGLASPPPQPRALPSEPARMAEAAPVAASEGGLELDSIMVTGSRIADADLEEGARPAPSIRLQPWEPDSPYARRLRKAAPETLYAAYLAERDAHAGSTAFYLDVADLLLARGRSQEALRVLSNLAELDLENRHILRVLGYRLMQAQAWPQAVRVFEQVLALADEEPQSHRDLGLALAAAGRRQEGIERLYEVAAREWDGRFSQIELTALNELNAIVATSPTPLDTGFVDPRLRRNLPLDLRVVLGWDSDNSDMDLWVTDPNGEKTYYSNPLSYQGGLMSDDFTGGYGPEEFVLREAKPGIYTVRAHYFGDQQQIVTGATTLTLTLSTGWGTARQQDQKVTMRLDGQDDEVLVGQFQVR